MRFPALFLLFFWTCCLAQRFPPTTISPNPLSQRTANYQVRFNADPTQGVVDLSVAVHWTFSPTDLSQVIDEVFLAMDPSAAGFHINSAVAWSEVWVDEFRGTLEEVRKNRLFRVPLERPCFVGRIVSIRYRIRYAVQDGPEGLLLHHFFPMVSAYSKTGWVLDPTNHGIFPIGTFLVELPADSPPPVTAMVRVPWMKHAYYATDVPSLGLWFSSQPMIECESGDYQLVCDPAFDPSAVGDVVQALAEDGLSYANKRLIVGRSDLVDDPPGMVFCPDAMSFPSELIDNMLRHQIGLYELHSRGLVSALADLLAHGTVAGPVRQDSKLLPAWWPEHTKLRQTDRVPSHLFLAVLKQNGAMDVAPCLDWCRLNAFRRRDARDLVASVWPGLSQIDGVPKPDLVCTGVSPQGYHYSLTGTDIHAPSPYLIVFGDQAWRLIQPQAGSQNTMITTPQPIHRLFWDPMYSKSMPVSLPGDVAVRTHRQGDRLRLITLEWLRSVFL